MGLWSGPLVASNVLRGAIVYDEGRPTTRARLLVLAGASIRSRSASRAFCVAGRWVSVNWLLVCCFSLAALFFVEKLGKTLVNLQA